MTRSRFGKMISIAAVLGLLLSACGGGELDVSGDGEPVSELGKAVDEIGGSGLAEVSRVLEADCLAGRGLTANEIDAALGQVVDATSFSAADFGVASSIRTDIDEMVAYLDSLADGGVVLDELSGSADQPGCRQIVSEKLNGPINSFFDEFGAELAQLERGYDADPRVASFWEKWSVCMEASGFGVRSVSQLSGSFAAEASDILAQVEIGPSSRTILDITAGDEAGLSDGGLDAGVERQIDDLQRREETAVEATTLCGVPPAEAIPPDLVDVRLEHEAEFLAKNGDRVAELQAEAAETFAAAVEEIG